MALFRPVSQFSNDSELQAVVALLEDENVPVPELSGVMLTEALLRQNAEQPELEEWRQRARTEPEGPFSLAGDRYLLRKGRLVVPEVDNLRTRIIEEIHSRTTYAHPGRNKTRKLVQSQYWFPGLASSVDRFVANCVCRSSKVPRDKAPGLLKPLPIPLRPWQHIVVDFKAMPIDRTGVDNVLVIVDRLSKFC